MPKFLDVPQWYNSGGFLCDGVGEYVINLTEEDYEVNSSEFTATATVNVTDLSIGTNVRIKVPMVNMDGVTIYRVNLTVISGQTSTLCVQYSIANTYIWYEGIQFTVTSYAQIEMGGKTLIFKNASVSEYEAYGDIILAPALSATNTIVVMNGTLHAGIVMPGGVSIQQFNGANPTYQSPSFYAPTTSGTSGQYLQSNGSGSAPTWADIEIPSNFTIGSANTLMLSQIIPENGFAIVWVPNEGETIGLKSVNYKNVLFVFRVEITLPANWYWYGIDNSGNWALDSYNASITLVPSGTTLYYIAFQNR